jgi:hypothetical protein
MSRGVVLWDLKDLGQCHWRLEGLHYCGKPCDLTVSYCPGHLKRMFRSGERKGFHFRPPFQPT